MSILEKNYGKWLVYWTLAFIWGTSFILIKKGVEAFPPDIVGTLRIAFTSIFFLPWALKNIHKISRKNIKSLLIAGFIGNFFPAILFSIAETHIPSALAGMLNATTPLFTWIVGILIYKARTSIITFIGIFVGFIGAIGLVINDFNNIFSGWNVFALFVLLATLLYGINTNELKYKLKDLDAISIASLSFFLTGPVAIIYLLARHYPMAYIHNPVFWKGNLAIITLAFFSSFIAMILFNHFVKYASAVLSASITYAIPIFAIFWGVVDGEKIHIHQIIAMIITITGVYLVNSNIDIKIKKSIPKTNKI